jgi:hypothetical protein
MKVSGKYFASIVLMLVFSWLFSASVTAQCQGTTLSGVVKNINTGQTVSGQQVIAYSPTTNDWQTTYTASNGTWSFNALLACTDYNIIGQTGNNHLYTSFAFKQYNTHLPPPSILLQVAPDCGFYNALTLGGDLDNDDAYTKDTVSVTVYLRTNWTNELYTTVWDLVRARDTAAWSVQVEPCVQYSITTVDVNSHAWHVSAFSNVFAYGNIQGNSQNALDLDFVRF